jgi:hypothetical protein
MFNGFIAIPTFLPLARYLIRPFQLRDSGDVNPFFNGFTPFAPNHPDSSSQSSPQYRFADLKGFDLIATLPICQVLIGSGRGDPMNTGVIHPVALAVFVGLFLVVTVLGFIAARWKAGDMKRLDEWAVADQRFGIVITWFLVGGDLYNAYTVIAVPALVYAVGAYGFFAIPYAVIIYPFLFAVMPRFWAACRRGGHLTAADFFQERFANLPLGVGIAITGLPATALYCFAVSGNSGPDRRARFREGGVAADLGFRDSCPLYLQERVAAGSSE